MPKNLADILQSYPHISLADESTNDELLDYYHQTELRSRGNSVIYLRGENFFNFLAERSEHFLVFTLRNDQKLLQGIAVISFRPGYIEGELTTIGYLGDLRVSLNRKLIREWRKFYGHLLEKSPVIPETKFCRYYQTALMSENSESKNNLANTKIANLYYKKMATYQMINIVGKTSFTKTQIAQGQKIRWAKKEDRVALINFLNADHKKRLFGHDWTQEFDRRVKLWKNFSIEDYIIIENLDNTILAVTSVWNPIHSKQILVTHVPVFFKALAAMTKLLPGISLKPIPKPKKPIEILYLNQISFHEEISSKDKIACFETMVEFTFSRTFNMLAYCEFDRDKIASQTKKFICQKNNLGFYTVHYKKADSSIRDELFLNDSDISPAFDMALV